MHVHDRSAHIAKVEALVKNLNQALLDAANDGLGLRLRTGDQPYSTGPTNETRWMYVELLNDG